jgi:hypothetical protein
MPNLAKKGEILARYEDGALHITIPVADAADVSVSGTGLSRLYATTGAPAAMKLPDGRIINLGLNLYETLPEAEISDAAKKARDDRRAAKRTGNGRTIAEM